MNVQKFAAAHLAELAGLGSAILKEPPRVEKEEEE